MKKEPKNVGAPKKYKPEVETITLHALIPKHLKKEFLNIIEEKVKDYLN